MVSEPIASLILALIAVTTSAWLTGRVRAYALARRLLDVPNVRSSHSTPTPRGGGVAIVVAVLLVLVAGVALKVIDSRLALALGGGGLLVAWVGWWDDHTGLRPPVRAAGHAVAALWALYWLGGYPTLRLGDFVVSLGPAGSLLALIGIVWAVNLFNFMDGIDGIAGVEAVTVGTGGALLLWAAGQSGGASVSLAIAAAALGFLFWNWAPARIFMGDAGSGFLGFSFAVLAIWSENTHGPSSNPLGHSRHGVRIRRHRDSDPSSAPTRDTRRSRTAATPTNVWYRRGNPTRWSPGWSSHSTCS